MMNKNFIYPGNWIGILGGGQLCRMLCSSAQRMGFKVMVIDPSKDSPAFSKADRYIQSDYNDLYALKELSKNCVSVTTEFENVPSESLRILKDLKCIVSPDYKSMNILQNRNKEKLLIKNLGIVNYKNKKIEKYSDIIGAEKYFFPGFLKLSSSGYDGKGQFFVITVRQTIEAFDLLKNKVCILESIVKIKKEFSLILVRGLNKIIKYFPLIINDHSNGILIKSIISKISEKFIYKKILEISIKILNKLNYFGILCIEFFLTYDNKIFVNEIAPRTHNSGHYTIDSCLTSQFEQNIRVITGQPLGNTRLLRSTIMLNLLGNSWFLNNKLSIDPNWYSILSLNNVKLHIYGKKFVKYNRKIGHINCFSNNLNISQKVFSKVSYIIKNYYR